MRVNYAVPIDLPSPWLARSAATQADAYVAGDTTTTGTVSGPAVAWVAAGGAADVTLTWVSSD